MARVSKKQAAQHREEAIEAASRLFRDRGSNEVGLAEVIAAIGLTQGGFYKQFTSKQALAAEATDRAFALVNADVDSVAEQYPEDPALAPQALVATYLSAQHRDNRADGYATTALSGDATRDEADGPVRAAYTRGVAGFIDALIPFTESDADHAERITTVCTLVGALTLSRATAGSALSTRSWPPLTITSRQTGPHQTKSARSTSWTSPIPSPWSPERTAASAVCWPPS